MTEDIKNRIIDLLKQNDHHLYTENIETTEEIFDDSNEEDVGITDKGIKYHKKALIDFLINNRYPLEESYISYYAERFSLDESGTFKKKHTRTVLTDQLDNITDVDLEDYINYVILKNSEAIRKSVKNIERLMSAPKQYDVYILHDRFNGALDTDSLQQVLTAYAKDGWTLKFVFTNSLGVNAFSVSHIGVNASVEDTILIFEKTSITDD